MTANISFSVIKTRGNRMSLKTITKANLNSVFSENIIQISSWETF